MPKISKTAQEESVQSLEDNLEKVVYPKLAVSTDPVIICGVNRKSNTGNYENIDVYFGITLPTGVDFSTEDKEEFKELVHEMADVGFGIASRETWERYALIKKKQKEAQATDQ